jgi:hypothetical protein
MTTIESGSLEAVYAGHPGPLAEIRRYDAQQAVSRVLVEKALLRTHCVVEGIALTDDELQSRHPLIIRPVD